jgi:murein DD-endopeptidase MepM/ murein hydrolase activator NlpD
MIQLLPVQKIRVDSQGNGNYGSTRQGHKHEGVDIEATEGETVFAPFDGTLTRVVKPYRPDAGSKAALNGFDFKAGEKTVRVFYAKPKNVGTFFKKGEPIGTVENVKQFYNSAMHNHIHVELFINGVHTDPTQDLTGVKKKLI